MEDIEVIDNVEQGEELQKIVRTIEDKANALHAHNLVRTLHGLDLLDWDDELADGANKWALHLANTDCGLSHSTPLTKYGENIYISKGGIEPSRSYHAVLLWYKGVNHFDFENPGFNLASGSFSQLVWKESCRVGLGIAYREDTRKTYIVAQYSPPGNTCYDGTYKENVSKPTAGLPAKLPKLDDLVSPQPSTLQHQRFTHPVEAPYGWARGIFRSMCKWCQFSGPKLVESWSGCPTLPDRPATNKNSGAKNNNDTEINSNINTENNNENSNSNNNSNDSNNNNNNNSNNNNNHNSNDKNISNNKNGGDSDSVNTYDNTGKRESEGTNSTIGDETDSAASLGEAGLKRVIIELTTDNDSIGEMTSASSIQFLNEVADEEVK